VAAEPQRQAGRGPIDSLTHPLRRRILRGLHRHGEARGPSEIATELGLMPSVVAYHVGVLATWETTREAGLADQRGGLLYESAVGEDPVVLALLKDREAEDEGKLAD
jgi:Helix-turn-helix domain